ncbi:hypothetical protein [Paenibacillus ginsengarvi]|uniref:hypothetical protein n=1 Tax=Paenibacillus ginsengarvi TaxID=400777 RepID=UPI00195FD1AF|nr:hypothetical protein [Paenibacillus ginsengarvi]
MLCVWSRAQIRLMMKATAIKEQVVAVSGKASRQQAIDGVLDDIARCWSEQSRQSAQGKTIRRERR